LGLVVLYGSRRNGNVETDPSADRESCTDHLRQKARDHAPAEDERHFHLLLDLFAEWAMILDGSQGEWHVGSAQDRRAEKSADAADNGSAERRGDGCGRCR